MDNSGNFNRSMLLLPKWESKVVQNTIWKAYEEGWKISITYIDDILLNYKFIQGRIQFINHMKEIIHILDEDDDTPFISRQIPMYQVISTKILNTRYQ